MKIGYLGPKGTFTEEAALSYIRNKEGVELIAFPTIHDAIYAVEEGEVEESIVPFENSTEGTVTNTIDTLIFDVDLYIKGEIIVPISQSIAVRQGFDDTIEKIYSHPQALAQCRKYWQKYFPHSELVAVSSTAEAAKFVSESTGPYASICPKRAADLCGLQVLEENIQDEKNNATRFVVLTKERQAQICSGAKTSIVFSTENRPGRLYNILDIISIWDLNMTKIESRPMKNQLGTYVFFVDLEADNRNDLLDCLKMMERKTTFLKYLGSYHSVRK